MRAFKSEINSNLPSSFLRTITNASAKMFLRAKIFTSVFLWTKNCPPAVPNICDKTGEGGINSKTPPYTHTHFDTHLSVAFLLNFNFSYSSFLLIITIVTKYLVSSSGVTLFCLTVVNRNICVTRVSHYQAFPGGVVVRG